MARRPKTSRDEYSSEKSMESTNRRTQNRRAQRKAKGITPGRVIFWAFLLGSAAFIVFLPKIATSQVALDTIIQRFAGLEPLQLKIGSADAGWFTAVRASDIELRDESGNVLAKVGEVQTEKGVIGWITGSSDLGKITLKRIETAIVAYEGTTNLEEALRPLIETYLTEPGDVEKETVTPSTMLGTIEIVDSKIVLADATRPERWVLNVPKVAVTLPHHNQIIGPVDLLLELLDASGTQGERRGQLAANVQQSESKEFEVRAKLENIPVDVWHVIQQRFPELPVNDLQGQFSAVLAGSMIDSNAWSFQVNELAASNLSIDAPELLGELPARLQSISGSCQIGLANSLLQLSQSNLKCDFARASAKATIPWPIEVPTAQDPFLRGAQIQAEGIVDLPKLADAAQSLIPLRKDMQLLSGTAQFTLGQSTDEKGQPKAAANLQLQNLQANSAGQTLHWNDPLHVEIAASRVSDKLQFATVTKAEFANLQARGSIESGSLDGSVDLSLLRERLGQWVELPILAMEGSATVKADWHLESNSEVVAKGELSTTPLVIATSAGKDMREDAWLGQFNTRLKLLDGTPVSVENGSIQLQSPTERLAFELAKPLHLVQSVPSPPPAAFSLDVHADLARCNSRSQAWLTQPPQVDVSGQLQLVANGLLDLNHIELLSANWAGRPIHVATTDFSLSEPRIVGNFRGLVDTGNLTRTKIETLEMTSSSVSLVARDQANPDGSDSRVGRAKFLMSLTNLMNSTQTQAIAGVESSAYSVSGQCDGELAWQISSQAAGVNLLVNAQDLSLMSRDPATGMASVVWQEPTASTHVAGTWESENNTVNIAQLSLEMPWLNYQGNGTFASNDEQVATVRGQATYDANQLAQKISSYTGGQLQMVGQHSMPVNIDWRSSKDAKSALAGLQAETRIGWDQAAVAGIVLGKADVPVTVRSGVLHTDSEIPVSGGFLRWDMDCDLTQDDLVLHQKPMTMLENVEITEQMCKGWLKYITPLLAETTSVDGRMSLRVDGAQLTPANPQNQTVAGQLVIHNASVGPGPLSNQVIGIVKQVEAIRKRDFTQVVSSTQQVWMDMSQQQVNFRMVNGRVAHDNLRVKIGDATIVTQGDVGVDGSMNMLASMPIPADWTQKSPWLASLEGQSLQFPVQGTFTSPQVNTQLLSQLGQQSIQNVTGNLLHQGINKGLDKLLGPQPNPQANPAAQPSGNMTDDPVMGIGEQILKGQGINLPGLFGK